MSKFKLPIVTLTLIGLIVLPGNLQAGPFGLFKHHRKKAKCCPPAACCQSAVVTDMRAAESGDPEDVTTYYCQAYFKGFPAECSVYPRMFDGTDCEETRAKAIQWLEDNRPEGCTAEIEGDCEPKCSTVQETEVAATTEAACVYKVTYKIYCCDGCPIVFPKCDENLEFAKFKAKTFACNYAALTGCKIKACCWVICRVPASQCP